MAGKVAIVTDSSAMLPEPVASGITVVPLQIIVDSEAYADGGPETSAEAVTRALSGRRSVSTSRPAPAALGQTYEALAAEGYDEIVSIHLSAEMSGTLDSARLAAKTSPVPVVTLDTRAVGPCLGFAVLAAAKAVDEGAGAEDAAAAALARAEATRSLFYVDTLDYLRRGGRIGAAAALLGSALAVKPLLAIEDGQVVLHERVRTAARALSRLEELAVEAAGERDVEVVVAHLDSPERAGVLREHLAERLAPQLGGREVRCGELGASLAVHVGPGMLAVVVSPAL
ncbi:DegV family protein [Nocardioides sp. KR10-350]|uniref:DegV family protein n=1 Tax=Nocardioides cheoyonin TaxID=3156615 RepID=UPI0032B4FAC5